MESRAKVLGHPAHQMLIVFPLGLLGTSVIFDLIYWFTGNPTFAQVGFWMTVSGIIGGLIASPFGTIDWLAIPQGTRAKSIGLLHGGGNFLVMFLFALSAYFRWGRASHEPDGFTLILALGGFLLSLATGWLGGELVDRLGVGVDDGAHLDAPSSLTHSKATERAAN
ncbi:MAG: DUF2231 domain-containing protein [Acidobacteriota bacterium]|nr:DUF2231 domain-containing protein [Acidobacteriota bacterium]